MTIPYYHVPIIVTVVEDHVCNHGDLCNNTMTVKVGSQYDVTPYIALRRLHVDTRRNATQH